MNLNKLYEICLICSLAIKVTWFLHSRTSKQSAVSEIFRFIKTYHDNPEENGVRDLYDTITPTYDETIRGVLYSGPKKVVDILKEYCSDKSVSILECGAGTGLIGEQLFSSGYKNVIGVDFSQKCLDEAEKKCVYKKLICAEIVPQGTQFNDNNFDVLISSGCIAPGHISPKCFPEWTRIVKRGGYVVIILRRCYVELQEGLEAFHSESLGELFRAEICNLEQSKRWEVVLRQKFPGYCYEAGILSDGIAVVCKVL